MAETTIMVPSWMTKAYFVDVVAKRYELSENEFEIREIDVKPATEAGDNFASKLFRVTIDVSFSDGTSKKLPLIVKALINLGMSEEIIQMLNVFPKEMEMYSEIITGFERLYREKGMNVVFGPKCYKNSTAPAEALVFEDLSEREFKMVNRREGLDRKHTEMVLKRLAQLHAASAVYHERNGSYSDKFNEGMYAERSMAMFEEHSKAHMESALKMIRTWPNGDFYSELMKDFGMSMYTELIKISRANPDGFNVLNHGDAWCNNFMFQYREDNAIGEIMLVDFQMCIWSSPVIDLLYFIFTSVNDKIRLPQLDDLLTYYHQNLVESLRLLDYTKKVPSRKELHLDFIDRIAYGFASSFGVLSICLMEKTDDASLDMMMSSEEAGNSFREKMYGNPVYVKQMAELLPFFNDYGAFDLRGCGYQVPSGVSSNFLTLPGWMRKEFFNEVVEKKLNVRGGQYSIERVWIEMATNKGDNYGSVMYRAKLDVDNKVTDSLNSFSVIVKTRPAGIAADFSNNLDPFTKEIDMYTRIIPAMEKLYKQKNVQVDIGPRCLKICRRVPSDIIVMEDLGSKRYKIGKRQEGLDQAHVEMILEKLAQFHAASAVYRELNGDYDECYKEGLYNKKNLPVMEHMFGPAYDACLEELQTLSFADDYIEDLKSLRSLAFSRNMDSLVVDPNGFNVLNHGDFWCNNVMFQYTNDGCLENSTLIDFQICFYGSPVLDLNYFLFTTVKQDIKLSKLNYFIRYYHEKLVPNLAVLGYSKPLPTLKQLQFDFYDRIVFGASTIFGIMAVCLVEPSDDTSMEAIHQDNETGRRFRKLMYANERYVKAMESLLPFFAQKGAFEMDAEVCNAAKRQC